MTNPIWIAVSILLGSGLVALAIFFSPSGTDNNSLSITRAEAAWVIGNPDAEITIVEFSDVECPFCARLHPTLERIVEDSEGKVKWEYRHLPLAIHRHAELGARATECVGELAGNEAFWQYLQILLDNQGNHSADWYQTMATEFAIDTDEYQSCLEDEEIYARVATDEQVAAAYGGRGTPFSVVVFKDGTTQPISGALPYQEWRRILNR